MIKIKESLTYMIGEDEGQVLMERVLDVASQFVELNLVSFDLNLAARDETNNEVTEKAAYSLLATKVAIKAPTITPTKDDVKSGRVKNALQSPNLVIRKIINGICIVRSCDVVPGVKVRVKDLSFPIVVLRMATEGPYGAEEWKDEGHVYQKQTMTKSKVQALAEFAFQYSRENNLILIGAAKETISKTFDEFFKKTFDETALENPDVSYQYWLIDALYAQMMKPGKYAGQLKEEGKAGLAIVCKNYDGDCLGDMIPEMYGSIAGAGSLLMGENGVRMYDPPHGTIPRHLGKNDANPLATLIAVSGAISYLGTLYDIEAAVRFGKLFKESAFEAIKQGVATRDLLGEKGVSTTDYLEKVAEILEKKLKRS